MESLAIDPSNPAIVYAGTDMGEVMKTTNAGETWRAAHAGMADGGVSALVIDPSAPSTLYAATCDLFGGTSGVYKSTNGGRTWDALNNGIENECVQALVMDPSCHTTLFAAGSRVLKSTDSGATWAPCSTGFELVALAIGPTNPNIVYAVGHSSALYKSTDGGTTWIAINRHMPEHSAVSALAVDAWDEDTVYVTLLSGALPGQGVNRSTDGGMTLREVNEGLDSLWVMDLAVDPSRPGILYAGTADRGVSKIHFTASGVR